MSRVRMRALLLVVLALCGGVAAAQAPDYSTLPVGKEQLARSSGAAGGELFRFLGLAGDRIGLLVNPDGYATVAVYDPDGRRLDGYAGSDARVLELTLPKDGLYFASVALRPAGNYIIKLERYHAAAPAAPVAPVLDPAWGLYAQLPGQTRTEVGGFTQSWRWEREGEVLVEEWRGPRNATKIVFTARITRGATPGTLLLSGDSMGGKQWAGQIAADGSVSWVGVKGMKLPFRVQLLPDARMRVDHLDKSGGVKNTDWYLPANAGGVPPGAQR